MQPYSPNTYLYSCFASFPAPERMRRAPFAAAAALVSAAARLAVLGAYPAQALDIGYDEVSRALKELARSHPR